MKLRGRIGRELMAIEEDSSPDLHGQVSSQFLKSVFSILVAWFYIIRLILVLCSRLLIAFIVSQCLFFPSPQLVILILKLNYTYIFPAG